MGDLQPVLDRTASTACFSRNNAGLNTDALPAAGLRSLGDQAMPRKELARRLAENYLGRDGRILASEVEVRSALIHDPATVGWDTRRSVLVTAIGIGEPASDEAHRLLPFVAADSVSFSDRP